MKNSLAVVVGWLHNIVNVINASKLEYMKMVKMANFYCGKTYINKKYFFFFFFFFFLKPHFWKKEVPGPGVES